MCGAENRTGKLTFGIVCTMTGHNHYTMCAQFHPKHNKAITDYKTFNEKADDYNTERPSMTSWRITSWTTKVV